MKQIALLAIFTVIMAISIIGKVSEGENILIEFFFLV